MDRLPQDYVLHNLPLLLLSGLNTSALNEPDKAGGQHEFLLEGGFRIKVDVPVIDGPLAERVLQSFYDQDASNVPWHSQSFASRNGRVFKIASADRVYTLPPRKAPPPPHSPRLSSVDAHGGPPAALVLHSPLSPLTPSSPLYPDGIVSPLWITKHQSRLPCAFVSFFSLDVDPNTSTLQDNKLKSEINNVRNVVSSANYKTRHVVVFLGEGPINSPDIDARLANIRQATTLDSKSIYFVPYNSSPVQITSFVTNFLSALQPFSVEYYRDLSKHARRKRNRSTTPQPTVSPGSSSILSSHGWNVRYEFKLGVFAEFRQEMDAAGRNYETAYESLLASEVIDAVTAWSPRFDEARMLADVIALRTVRCLLWTSQPITAVRSWVAHRDRSQNLVNRRGKSTDSYGWEAWQSAWARAMADLISRSQYPLLNTKLPSTSDLLPIYIGEERLLPATEKLTPWEQLHHEGYWLDISKNCTLARQILALQIPEEDRLPPGRSPPGAASKARLFDTHLALEPYHEVPADGSPGFDYAEEIVSTLESSILQFSKRDQLRKIDSLRLQKASQHIEQHSWAEATATLRNVWTNEQWRQAGWWQLLQGVGWALLDCLAHVKDGELLLALLWELSSNAFDIKPGTDYDPRQALESYDSSKDNVFVAIDMDETLSPLAASFAFSSRDVSVGDTLDCQLAIQSRSHNGLPMIHLSEIKIAFDGNMKPVHLTALGPDDAESNETASKVKFVDVRWQDTTSMSSSELGRSSVSAVTSQIGTADLAIPSTQTRIFCLSVVPREAGELSIASITLTFAGEKFTVAATTSDFSHTVAQWWETKAGVPVLRTLGVESNASNTVNIQPKPPKLTLQAPGLRRSYYTDEAIVIEFEVINEEDEEVAVTLEARMISPVAGAAQVDWAGSEKDASSITLSGTGILTLSSRDVGTIRSSGKTTVSINITDTAVAVDHELELTANYHLVSEPETLLSKTITVDVGVIRPFEANYEFIPRLDGTPWPNFFEAPPASSDTPTPGGLKHLYSVAAGLYSFATDVLVIEAILLTATKISGGAVCSSSTGIVRAGAGSAPRAATDAESISTLIKPETTELFDFDLTLQKLVLGDRRTVAVDLEVEIGWRRQDATQVNSTVLPAARLTAPMAEPQVMLTVSPVQSKVPDRPMYSLSFTIENPSMHFLTFNVSMEASEDFAFSGPKVCAVSLVPVSRHVLSYRILPNKRDEWIGVHLNVVDAYFGQTLKVFAGGKGVRVDKKGNLLIKV